MGPQQEYLAAEFNLSLMTFLSAVLRDNRLWSLKGPFGQGHRDRLSFYLLPRGTRELKSRDHFYLSSAMMIQRASSHPHRQTNGHHSCLPAFVSKPVERHGSLFAVDLLSLQAKAARFF